MQEELTVNRATLKILALVADLKGKNPYIHIPHTLPLQGFFSIS